MKIAISFSIIAVAICLLATSCASAEQIQLSIKYKDGQDTTYTERLHMKGGHAQLVIDTLRLKEMKEVKVSPVRGHVKAGKEGYYVTGSSMQVKFLPPEYDSHLNAVEFPLPLSMTKTGNQLLMGINKGMKWECRQRVTYTKGNYDFSTIYDLKDIDAYEPLTIDYYLLKGKEANYSAAARKYRHLRIQEGALRPLREKTQERTCLKYIVDAPEIRIRMGWKPVPTPVLEQTLENEPAMITAVTFDRVKDIVDSLYAAGVKRAQLCLVGWNVKGHDGRFPEVFPVEPQLGGEEKLRECITYAQSKGYQIVGHSNRTDIFHIASGDDYSDYSKNAQGKLIKKWKISGGQMYDLCYKIAYEKYFKRDEPKIRQLGFKGVEFIDVLSIVNPHDCYDPTHPVNKREAEQYALRMLQEASQLFGGIQSEGAIDFTSPCLDYALYTSMNMDYPYKMDKTGKKRSQPLADAFLPVWNIVYHGSILSTPGSQAVNYTIKPSHERLKMLEFCSRPIFYFYSAYRNKGANWMGEQDLHCADGKELHQAVQAIKEGYDEYQKYAYLQYETMDHHEEVAPGITVTSFSNGHQIVVNYTSLPYTYQQTIIPPYNWQLVK